MSQGEIARLHATIGADITGLQKGLQDAEGLLSGWGSRLDRWGAQLQGVGAALSVGVGIPAATFLRGITTAAGSFEAQMNILDVAAREDAEAFGVLDDAAIKIGQDVRLVGINNAMAAEAMTTLYKSGYDTTQIFGDLNAYMTTNAELAGILRGAVDLAAASDIDLAQSTDLVATAMKVFGLSEKDAIQVADAFVKAADMSKSEVSDLAMSLTNFGPIAAQMGLSLEDAVIYLAMLSDKGLEGAEAGTALRSMFGMMQRETADATEAWEEMGVSLYDTSGNLRELPDLWADIQKKMWDPATTDQQRERWTKSIFSQYGRVAAQMLMPRSGVEWETYSQKFEDAATAAQVAEARTKGWEAQVENLSGAIETFLTVAGIPFIEKFGTPAIQVITNIVNALGELPEGVIANLGLAAAGLVALGPALVGIGTALRVVAFLGPTFVLAAGAIGAVAGAVLLLSDAGRGFIKGLWQWDEAIYKLFGVDALDKWIKFRKGLDEVTQAIRAMPSGKAFAAWLDIEPGATAEDTWRRIGETVWQRVQEGARRLVSGEWLAELLQTDVGDTPAETWMSIGGQIWDELTTDLPMAVGGFVGRMMGWDVTQTDAGTWADLGATVWARVKEGLHAKWQGVGNWVADLLKVPETEASQAGWDEVGVWLRDQFQGVLARYLPQIDWGTVFAAGGGLVGFVTALGAGLLDALRAVDWGQTFQTLWAEVSGAVLGALGTAGEALRTGDALADLLGLDRQEGEGGWQAIGRTIVAGIADGMATAETIGVRMWQGLVRGFRAAYTGLGEMILSLLEGEGLEKSLSDGLKVATDGLPQKMRHEMGSVLGAAAEQTEEENVWTRVGRRIWDLIVQGMRDALGALKGLGLSGGEFLLGLLGGERGADETVYQALGRTIWEGIQQGLTAAAGAGAGAYQWLAGQFQGAADYITALLTPDGAGETPLLASLRTMGARLGEAVTDGLATVQGTAAYEAVAGWIDGIATSAPVTEAMERLRGVFGAGGFFATLFGGGAAEDDGLGQDFAQWAEQAARDVGETLNAEMAEGSGPEAMIQQWRNNFQAVWEAVWGTLFTGGGMGARLGLQLRGLKDDKDLAKGAMMLGGAISATITDFLTCGAETLSEALHDLRGSRTLRDAGEALGGSIGGFLIGAIAGFFAKAENGRPLIVALIEGMVSAAVEGAIQSETLGLAIQRVILEAIMEGIPDGWLGEFLQEGLERRIEHIDIVLGARDVQVSREAQRTIAEQVQEAAEQGAPYPAAFAQRMYETVAPPLSWEPITAPGGAGGMESNYEAMFNNMRDMGVPEELIWFMQKMQELPGGPAWHLKNMRTLEAMRDAWLQDEEGEVWQTPAATAAGIPGLGNVPGLHVPTYPNMAGEYPGDTVGGDLGMSRPYQVQVPGGMSAEEFAEAMTLTDEEWLAQGRNAGSAYGTGFRTGYESAMNLNLDAFSARLLKQLRAAGVPY